THTHTAIYHLSLHDALPIWARWKTTSRPSNSTAFSDRTSCHGWWANQFRVLWSAGAYVLVEALRRLGLAGTELARAQVGTIRREIGRAHVELQSLAYLVCRL